MQDNKILIIPDVHGREFWKEAKTRVDECSRVIFLGDYLDPYEFEHISIADAFSNFQEIIEFKLAHPDKVVLLLGNHDLPYYSSDYNRLSTRWCRYCESFADVFAATFAKHKNLFKLAHAEAGVLFTHAGVRSDWYAMVGNPDADTLAEIVDNINNVMTTSQVDLLYQVTYYRGGPDSASSCVWADVLEHDSADTLSKRFYQIFGHTLQAGYNNTGGIEFAQPVITETFAMIDNAKCYDLDNIIPGQM